MDKHGNLTKTMQITNTKDRLVVFDIAGIPVVEEAEDVQHGINSKKQSGVCLKDVYILQPPCAT